MKIFCVAICLSVFVAAFVQAEDDDPHASVRAKCRDELKLTDEILKEGLTNPKDFGCYLFCFLKDINVMNEIGAFDPEAAIQSIRTELRDAAKPHITTCLDLGKSMTHNDACISASKLVECFKDRAAKLYAMLGIFQPPVKSE